MCKLTRKNTISADHRVNNERKQKDCEILGPC